MIIEKVFVPISNWTPNWREDIDDIADLFADDEQLVAWDRDVAHNLEDIAYPELAFSCYVGPVIDFKNGNRYDDSSRRIWVYGIGSPKPELNFSAADAIWVGAAVWIDAQKCWWWYVSNLSKDHIKAKIVESFYRIRLSNALG